MNKKGAQKQSYMSMRSDERLASRIAYDILPMYPAEKVLDVGCGDGIIYQIYNNHTQYLGLDISEACIYKQDHSNPALRYVSPEMIPAIMVDEGPWDMILLLDVIEHTRGFTDLFELSLQNSSRHIVVSLPNELFILDRLRMLAGKELNAHSLDRHQDPEGFKHQYIINIDKSREILIKSAEKHHFYLDREIFRPLKTKNKLTQPFVSCLRTITSPQLWSMGSVFVFSKN